MSIIKQFVDHLVITMDGWICWFLEMAVVKNC